MLITLQNITKSKLGFLYNSKPVKVLRYLIGTYLDLRKQKNG